MRINNKNYIITYSILLILLFLTIILRASIDIFSIKGMFDTLVFYFNSFYFLAVVVIWILSVNRRVLSIPFKKQYSLIAVLLIITLVLKMIKYRFSINDDMDTMLWYLYYFPFLLIPVNSLLASMYLGKNEGYHISRKWYFLFIPSILLILLFITNNYHELIYKFNDNGYTRMPLFYVTTIWIFALFIATFINTFIKCKIIKSKRKAFVPLIIVIVSIILLTIQSILDLSSLPKTIHFPDLATILIVIFLESLLSINLVRTNVGYEDFYKKTNISSIITDESFNPIYETNTDININIDNLKEFALNKKIYDPNYKLSCTKINGGYFFFGVDITDINKLKEELNSLGISLDDENEILKIKNELLEKEVRIKNQTEIISKINDLIKSDVIRLNKLINSLNDSNYEHDVIKTFLPICYIKRRINLFLIYYNEKKLSSKELLLSLNELLEYVKILGIDAGCYLSDDFYGGYDVIYLFEEIYEVICYYLDIMTSIYINCSVKDNKNIVVIMIDHTVKREYKSKSYSYIDNTSTIKIVGGDIHD